MATVLVPLAQGCEELEAVTVIDLLRRGGIEVVTASLDGAPVKASRGVTLVADTDLDQALQRDYDMVVLPGGLPGADHLEADQRIADLLKRMAESERFTAAICAAPKVLASAGLLENRRATAYPGILEKVRVDGLKASDEAVVSDGKVITSRGPGTAMDFALTLVERLRGQQVRDDVEQGLQRG